MCKAAQHRVEPTGLYRRSNRYLAWSETAVSGEVGCASATRRLTHTVGQQSNEEMGI
jgi:hypothetical protein